MKFFSLIGQQSCRIFEFEKAEELRTKNGPTNAECVDSLKAENDKLKAAIAEAEQKYDLSIAKLKLELQDAARVFEKENEELRSQCFIHQDNLEKLQLLRDPDPDLSVSTYVDGLIQEKSKLEWTAGRVQLHI